MNASVCQIRFAQTTDLTALVAIEEQSFSQDRLSNRSLKRWICGRQGLLMVA